MATTLKLKSECNDRSSGTNLEFKRLKGYYNVEQFYTVLTFLGCVYWQGKKRTQNCSILG